MKKKGECIYVNLLIGLDMVVCILRLYVPYINFPWEMSTVQQSNPLPIFIFFGGGGACPKSMSL